MNLVEIDKSLSRIETLLQRLIVPIEAEEARQLITASPEQLREHNRSIVARAKQRRLSA